MSLEMADSDDLAISGRSLVRVPIFQHIHKLRVLTARNTRRKADAE